MTRSNRILKLNLRGQIMTRRHETNPERRKNRWCNQIQYGSKKKTKTGPFPYVIRIIRIESTKKYILPTHHLANYPKRATRTRFALRRSTKLPKLILKYQSVIMRFLNKFNEGGACWKPRLWRDTTATQCLLAWNCLNSLRTPLFVLQ